MKGRTLGGTVRSVQPEPGEVVDVAPGARHGRGGDDAGGVGERRGVVVVVPATDAVEEGVLQEVSGRGPVPGLADAALDEAPQLGVLEPLERRGRDAPGDVVEDLHDAAALGVGHLPRDHLQHAHAVRVDVHRLRVRLRVQLRRHELRRAQDGVRHVRLVHDRRQPEVADLDLAVVAIDEDVAAVEVAVDDAGVVGVEVVEPLEDLARPLLERLDGDVAVSVAVLAEAPGGADLGDEVEDAGVAVQPHLVEADDVVVAERAEEAHLGVEALHHAGVAVGQRPQPDAVPRHLDPLLLVEPAVHLLDGPEPQHVRVPPEPPRRVHLLERLLAVHAVHRHGGGGSGFARARDAARRAADAAVRARVEGWGGAQDPIFRGEPVHIYRLSDKKKKKKNTQNKGKHLNQS